MPIKEAIILAGGLGTRLRDAIPDLPKCMAPVAGRTFLFYVINYLRSQGIEKFIFSLGYKHEIIETYLDDQFSTLNYQSSIEDEPLGTGGAIALACKKATDENILVVNGDTLFKFELEAIAKVHSDKKADATLALKPMEDFDRYGTVELESDGSVKNFKEKQYCKSGSINGGVYVLNTSSFLKTDWPAKFSFEKDYLESGRFRIYGVVQDAYFIDIGIPSDYARAQTELQQPPLDLRKIDKDWTLFIDRDGVINHEKKGDYIRTWSEFIFYDGAKEAFALLNKHFGNILVVSNQRGVGKGLMTEADLLDIHQRMLSEIEKTGAKIDGIYFCTSTDSSHPNRKPNPGIAFKARNQFPGVNLEKAIMVGNKPSDMQFGRNAGIYTVFIRTTNPDQTLPHPDIDSSFDSLDSFAKAL